MTAFARSICPRETRSDSRSCPWFVCAEGTDWIPYGAVLGGEAPQYTLVEKEGAKTTSHSQACLINRDLPIKMLACLDPHQQEALVYTSSVGREQQTTGTRLAGTVSGVGHNPVLPMGRANEDLR